MTDKTEAACRALITELHLALTDETREATGTRMTLRDAVCDYVAVEQARGTSLKKVIQIVKDILRKAEEAAFTATAGSERKDNNLAKQLVDWCVEFHHAALTRAS
jgi:hypothetical protein